jgi:AraC family transcriptional regulator of adaptative response / DNA-3-methyladenine glycosylase II
MGVDDDAKYRALVARDARFDGVFFVGVTTTGIYCRPVCTARTPGRSRCVFFKRAAEAERDGFRACFRCRPELAPGTSAVDAVSALARNAAARIEAGALNDGSLDDLARELGASARHVRRALEREMGLSPVQIAQSARLAIAKQLLQDGTTSIADVAYASGFSSVRRFNASFRERFARSPSSIRRRDTGPDRGVRIALGYRAPMAWRAMLEFLGPRATPGVEHVDLDALVYTRTLRIGPRAGTLSASIDEKRRVVNVDVSVSLARSLMAIAAAARRAFDLDAQPHAIDAHLARDATLRPFVRATPGIRVPGGFDSFELAARAVLGQQITVRGATTLAGRLARAFGEPIETTSDRLSHVFPSADQIARARDLESVGLTSARAAALRTLASHVIDESITSIKGIGPWTAQYVAMRALRSPDAFPSTDLILRPAAARADAWSPWRAYAAMHIWRNA